MINENLNSFLGKPIQDYKIGEKIEPNKILKISSRSYDKSPTIVDQLQALITSGFSTNLQAIIFGVWQEAWDEKPPYVSFLIENRQHFPKLEHIFSGDMTFEDCEISWIVQTNYEDFFKSYSDLKTFYVRGANGLRFGHFSLPQLNKFVLESGGTNRESILDLIQSNAFQNLEHLEIWFGTEDYGANVTIQDIKALFDMHMPKLKHLGPMNSDLQTEIVTLLATHPITKQIETLDISMGILKDAGGEALLQSDNFNHLKHITCKHHYISEELCKKIKEKYGDRISITEPEDSENGEWYYVEVGE